MCVGKPCARCRTAHSRSRSTQCLQGASHALRVTQTSLSARGCGSRVPPLGTHSRAPGKEPTLSTFLKGGLARLSVLGLITAGVFAAPACSSSSSPNSNSSTTPGPAGCTTSTQNGAEVEVLSTQTPRGSHLDVTKSTASDGSVHETFDITRNRKPFLHGDFTHGADGTLTGTLDYQG